MANAISHELHLRLCNKERVIEESDAKSSSTSGKTEIRDILALAATLGG